MKSFMANANTANRGWVVVDADNIPLGRLASQVASILRGKNKPTFTPHVDCGDFVIVLNADKVALTGKKLTDKLYSKYSGYQSGLKQAQYKDLMATRSDFVVAEAVKGMLPKTRLGRQMIVKLKVYKGAEHPHEAQQPKEVKLVGGRN